VNPKYSNVCAVRIGTWREHQCWSCKFLSECDFHYDDKTGEFDYPVLWHTNEGKDKREVGKHFKTTNKEGGQRRRIYETQV
jgi:hypothetical protein